MTFYFFSVMISSLFMLSIYSLGAQGPSLERPALITEDTMLELTEDISIDRKGTPFIAAPSLGKKKTEKLIITSQNGSALRVTSRGQWDLSSFNKGTTRIEFRGNVRVILEPGARLHGSNTKLVFAEQSRLE